MARIRKTASIAAVLKRTNHRLLHSTCEPGFRQGIASGLEAILHEAGLYAGFGYLSDADMAMSGHPNEKPGIRYSRVGDTEARVHPPTAEEWVNDLTDARTNGREPRLKQEFPDESRRFYYVSRHIHAEYRKLEKDGES
jgi:hypothetical protein